MKKNEVRYTLVEAIKYLKKHIGKVTKNLTQKIDDGEIKVYEANKQILILRDYQEALKVAYEKGYTSDELQKLIRDAPAKRTVNQAQLKLY
jgi:hypothetical protein